MDMAFKALTAGLGVTTIYLAATFSFNVYRGLAWHSEQSVSASAAQSLPPSRVPSSPCEAVCVGISSPDLLLLVPLESAPCFGGMRNRSRFLPLVY